MSRIEIRGQLGGDMEVKSGPGGGEFGVFSVAENHGYRNRDTGEWVEQGTTWYRCTVDEADLPYYADRATVGRSVIVYGDLRSREYEGRNGTGVSLDVRVNGVKFLPVRDGDSTRGRDAAGASRYGADTGRTGGNGPNTHSDGSRSGTGDSRDLWGASNPASSPGWGNDTGSGW